eukprot:s1666_g10.t1
MCNVWRHRAILVSSCGHVVPWHRLNDSHCVDRMGCVALGSRRSRKYADDVEPLPAKAAGTTASAVGKEAPGGVKSQPSKEPKADAAPVKQD